MTSEKLHVVIGSSPQAVWVFPFPTELEANVFIANARMAVFAHPGYIANQLGCIEWGHYPTALDSPLDALKTLLTSLKKD
jgi:hypothetical protein